MTDKKNNDDQADADAVAEDNHVSVPLPMVTSHSLTFFIRSKIKNKILKMAMRTKL